MENEYIKRRRTRKKNIATSQKVKPKYRFIKFIIKASIFIVIFSAGILQFYKSEVSNMILNIEVIPKYLKEVGVDFYLNRMKSVIDDVFNQYDDSEVTIEDNYEKTIMTTESEEYDLEDKYWALDYSKYFSQETNEQILSISIDLNDKIQDQQVNIDFLKPLDGKIGSEFGMRIHPLKRIEFFHKGIDIEALSGVDIYAAGGGVVEQAVFEPSYGYFIKIKHNDTFSTLYAHCSKLLVERGDKVSKGEKIALVGATGLVNGPHLHFELFENGTQVNPRKYIEF